MADKEDGFVEKIEGPVSPEKVAMIADEIGEEGTLASIRARVTRIRQNPVTGDNEEVPAAKPEVKAKEGESVPEKGDGKGSAADKLDIKPVAFSAPGYLKGKSDGQLFFISEKGSPNTDMDDFGPGSAANLSKDDLWSVISYMRKTFTK